VTQSALPRMSVLIPTIGSDRLGDIVARFLADPAPAEIIVAVDKPDIDQAVLAALPTDPRLKVVINPVNLGLTRSLNRAIGMALGEIIVRNDDDDIPAPDRLTRLLGRFDAEPATDIVFSHAIGQDADSGRQWLIGGPTDDAAVKAALQQRNFIVHSSIAFRRSSLEPLGFYDETFRYAQDYDLYLRACAHGLRFSGIDQPLVTRIYGNGSITVSKRRQQMLYSMSARLIHDARTDGGRGAWRTITSYTTLLIVPDWLRRLRRRFGHGR
jgi:GT2 family glycosyltransferase